MALTVICTGLNKCYLSEVPTRTLCETRVLPWLTIRCSEAADACSEGLRVLLSTVSLSSRRRLLGGRIRNGCLNSLVEHLHRPHTARRAPLGGAAAAEARRRLPAVV